MLLQIRTTIVKKGFAKEVIAATSKRNALNDKPGFIDRTVYLSRRPKEKGTEEVVTIVRWASVEDWKNWEKSPEHIAGHRAKKDKEKPEYILGVSMQMIETVDVEAYLAAQEETTEETTENSSEQ